MLRRLSGTGLACNLVHPAGFEPTTPAFGGQYSIQLSYGCSAGDIIPMSARGVHAGFCFVGSGRPRVVMSGVGRLAGGKRPTLRALFKACGWRRWRKSWGYYCREVELEFFGDFYSAVVVAPWRCRTAPFIKE